MPGILRVSTGLTNNSFYQVVRDPNNPNVAAFVFSDRTTFPATYEALTSQGYEPHPDFVVEKDGEPRLFVPQTLPRMNVQFLSDFVSGEVTTDRPKALFKDIRDFIKRYVWFERTVYYDLTSLLVFLSFWVVLFPAIPIVEVLGTTGSGKTTLLYLLSTICRSGFLSSTCSMAALARARHYDYSTLLLDEPLRKPDHPIVLGSYKNGETRTICGPGNELLFQNIYGLTLKVQDTASEALKSRTISLEITPLTKRLPPFCPQQDHDRIQSLVGNLLSISLTHFESIQQSFADYIANAPLAARALEKWSPLIAIARWIDESAPNQEPITPGIEALMAESRRLQKEERTVTDPALLVLIGVRDYLQTHPLTGHENSAWIPVSRLTEFISRQSEASFTPQQVSALLRLHGLIQGYRRSRKCPGATATKANNPMTFVDIDVAQLRAALLAHDLEENPEDPEVEKCGGLNAGPWNEEKSEIVTQASSNGWKRSPNATSTMKGQWRR